MTYSITDNTDLPAVVHEDNAPLWESWWAKQGRERFWAVQTRLPLVEQEVAALMALTAGNPGKRDYHLSRQMQARIGDLIADLQQIKDGALPCPDEAEAA